MKRQMALGLLLTAIFVAPALPVQADSLYQDGPNSNMTSFFRPELGVGNLITILINENNTAETDTNLNTAKTSELQGTWDFGALIPKIVKSQSDLKGQDTFQGSGTTSRNGKIQIQVTARIEEVLPNGTLRIVGTKHLQVNDEETDITISGIVRPLDISPENSIDSSKIADAKVNVKGSGPGQAKATPGLLTRLLNWLF